MILIFLPFFKIVYQLILLFKLIGTSLNIPIAYHPQSYGQSKVLNKCLEMYLRCLTYDFPKDWFKLLPWM